MGEIRSGTLDLRFETSMKGDNASGFELSGPFSLTSDGELPIAELEHKRFDGDNAERTGTFVSTGTEAFVVRKGKTTKIPPEQIASSGLSALVSRDTEDSGLGRLDIGNWITGRPDVSAGGLVGGVDTDKVTARLDPGRVLNGLIELGRALGGAKELQILPAAERARLKAAVDKAQLEVWSGKEDRLLRKLTLEVVFGVRKELKEKLKRIDGATISLEASITKLNERVRVKRPD
jgi:hypothetical protein